MNVWTIVVAAGSGTRFGGAKQFEILDGVRVIDRSIRTAVAASGGVVVVAAEKHIETLRTTLAVEKVVTGGNTRSESVRAGLEAIPADAEIIVVHDAARPLASAKLFEAVIRAVAKGADAAIPGVPVVDTIKRVSGMPTEDQIVEVTETVDRSELIAVQTPQAFRAETLRRAHSDAPEASDDAGLIEAIGGVVIAVPGSTDNRKITVPADLIMMEAAMKVLEHE